MPSIAAIGVNVMLLKKGEQLKFAVAFDPGRTTGYALAGIQSHALHIAYGQDQFSHDELWKFLCNIPGDANIVCEGFEYRQKSRDGLDLYPVELIGVIKLFVEKYHNADLFMQSASKGKGYYSDDKLETLSLYHRGIPHGRDAARHLLHWFTFAQGYQYNTGQNFYLETEDWIRKHF